MMGNNRETKLFIIFKRNITYVQTGFNKQRALGQYISLSEFVILLECFYLITAFISK